MQDGGESEPEFRLRQRVHSAVDPRRIGSVEYVGPLTGLSGIWVGVDWNNGDGKHDGSINGVRYFQAKSQHSSSFVRTQFLSPGISFLQALDLRYRANSTKEEEDEMYVLSSSNKRVSVQLVGKDKIQDKLSRFDELVSASLSYLGVSFVEGPNHVANAVPSLAELDLSGNLLSQWQDVATICEQLPPLTALNLSYNLLSKEISGLCQLKGIHILVLNYTGISWKQVELLKHLLPEIEELHLMGNNISEIMPGSFSVVQGFNSLRLLNMEDNCISDWDEILKLRQLRSLEHLYLNKNNLSHVFYPENDRANMLAKVSELQDEACMPFQNLQCLLLGNNIEDLSSIDSLNSFPSLSVSRRERKESEIRYIRLVMSKLPGNPEEIKRMHPRYDELKEYHGIEDERPSSSSAGPQKMASGLLSITLKCVGASMGEKPSMTKKLPATTKVGKLKILCEGFFKLKSIKPKFFIQEEGSPVPTQLDDDVASLFDAGVGNESTILVDEGVEREEIKFYGLKPPVNKCSHNSLCSSDVEGDLDRLRKPFSLMLWPSFFLHSRCSI